jgi:RNA polymerase sigma-70 factor (ECF subfamily)
METPTTPSDPRLPALLAQLRPRLHRYCARMTGSVLDGEDLVQEVSIKAWNAEGTARIEHLESWLFTIAHNAAMDFLRRRAREQVLFSAEDPQAPEASEPPAIESRALARLALRGFMVLPPAQRSAVLLADVLEYPLDEAASIVQASLPAFKASLHRGRTALQRQGAAPDAPPPRALSADQQAVLALYVERFNARDFDGLLQLMAAEVRLDLVGRDARRGRTAVATYFGNYRRVGSMHAHIRLLEGRAALWVESVDFSGEPLSPYAIVFEIHEGRIRAVRDFRHAPYAMEPLQ